jgi:hypothetical protein
VTPAQSPSVGRRPDLTTRQGREVSRLASPYRKAHGAVAAGSGTLLLGEAGRLRIPHRPPHTPQLPLLTLQAGWGSSLPLQGPLGSKYPSRQRLLHSWSCGLHTTCHSLAGSVHAVTREDPTMSTENSQPSGTRSSLVTLSCVSDC